ncbi:restriction endonuclease subunit S [Massilia cavernae]|uniref:restriction endonuclease subunit S n=1 Tax=Massilia cavernae TaxID=2320864 RepID=UPI0016009F89|nr:restriction endonuclease subunit S [Massilia cavernae]
MSAIPVGHKQTEVGVIPEDWAAKLLGSVIRLQRGFDLPYRNRRPGPIPIISSSGVCAYHDEPQAIGPGVVTGRYGTIGEVFFVDENYWPLNTTLFVKEFKGNDPLFISFLLRTIDFHSHSGKSGVPGINRNDLHELVVACPPFVEQGIIAEALSDADALIESLGQLVNKKRHLKQGAAQELLTRKKRLPGFSGDWEVKRFGDVVAPRNERIDPWESGVQEFCIELEHIGSSTGALLGNTSTGENSSLKSVFRAGDVLFGKLRAYLRKYWRADRAGVCSTEIWVLAPRENLITGEYLFQLVQTDKFIEVASYSYGTHMPRSDWTVVKNYELSIPLDPEEQTAIANALSDMDSEIAELEAKLAKARTIKQGMMHQLLTGKIRLI